MSRADGQESKAGDRKAEEMSRYSQRSERETRGGECQSHFAQVENLRSRDGGALPPAQSPPMTTMSLLHVGQLQRL